MRSVIAILAVICASAHAQRAIVVFTTGSGAVRGNVTFTQEGDTVMYKGQVEGLTPGLHGFHVHEKGDLSSSCMSTGGHYNPYKKDHGGPNDVERHVGDLGNIEAGADGVAEISSKDKIISLTGPTSIVGRAVVIHSDKDDLGLGGYDDSKKTGHAGSRVSCGIIGTLETGLSAANSARNWEISFGLMSLVTVFAYML